MGRTKKNLKYFSRYYHSFPQLLRGHGIGTPSESEYWLSWAPFNKNKYMIFRMHSQFGQGYLIFAMMESFELADEMGFIPVLYWGDTLELLGDLKQTKVNNHWDYFFKQDTDKVLEAKTVLVANMNEVYSNERIKRRLHVKNYDRGYLECADKEWREIFSNYNYYYKKWFIIQDGFRKEIENEWNEMIEDKNRIMGVMLREELSIDRDLLSPSDAMHNHPWVLGIDEIIDYVKEFKRKYNYSQIYVASMFSDAISIFQDAFGKDNIVFSNRSRVLFKDFCDYRINISHNEKDFESAFRKTKRLLPYDLQSNSGYFKDIIFCSKCNSLMGHMCSGTRCALMINGGEYEHYEMFPNKKELNLSV